MQHMNKMLGLFAAGVMAASAGQAYAAGVGIGGDAGLGVSVGGTEIEAGASLNASGTATGTVQSEERLEARVQSGRISPEARRSILELKGDARSLIRADADVEAFNKIVIQERPSIKEVKVEGNGVVAVNYIQPARFLGIFPASLKGTVRVDADGEVQVRLPWWSAFFAKNTAKVKSAVTAAVQASKTDANVEASAEARAQYNAQVVNAVTAAVHSEVRTEAEASAE